MNPITNFILLTTAALCCIVLCIGMAMFAMHNFKQVNHSKNEWVDTIANAIGLTVVAIMLFGLFALCQFHAINGLR